MRGKHLRTDFPREADGITPADAGKTNISSRKRRAFEDHPRGCGENLAVGDAAAVKKGSPPRMRGKH